MRGAATRDAGGRMRRRSRETDQKFAGSLGNDSDFGSDRNHLGFGRWDEREHLLGDAFELVVCR